MKAWLTWAGALAAWAAGAAPWSEDFADDPAARGWSIRGEASLFAWNRAAGRLEVTWDSERTNSFFHRPLGTVLTRHDDFRFGFVLGLDELRPRSEVGTFQIAVGLLRRGEAFGTNFFRGAGIHPVFGPRNIVEFDYFPGAGVIAPTFSAVLVGTNYVRWSMVNLFPLELVPGERYVVEVAHVAATSGLSLTVRRNGDPHGQGTTRIFATPDDFRVDTFSITSWSGARQPANYGGGIYARGWIDDLVVEVPDPGLPGLAWSDGNPPTLWCARRDGWDPVLHGSRDLQTWERSETPATAHADRWEWSPGYHEPAVFYRLAWNRP